MRLINYRKKKCFSTIMVLLLTISVVRAYQVVSITIYKGQSGSDSINVVHKNGDMKTFGFNDTTSERPLWAEVYQDVIGPDKRIDYLSKLMPPGTGDKENFVPLRADRAPAGQYYMHLDPDGTL
ncbi:MAG: hypothetical protein N2167_11850 [Flavobacteriales bacterium]|nr:hypothetical protein [Flavobacteriales bacterium]